MSPSFIRFGRAGENYKDILKWARGIIETLRTTVPSGDLLDLDLQDIPKISSVFPEDGTRNIVEDVLDDYRNTLSTGERYFGSIYGWDISEHAVERTIQAALIRVYQLWKIGNGSTQNNSSKNGFKWAERTLENVYEQIDAKIEQLLEVVDESALKKKDAPEVHKITQYIAESASDISEDLKDECLSIPDDYDEVDRDRIIELISGNLDPIDDDIMYLMAARVREILPIWKDDSMNVGSPGYTEDQLRNRLITFYDSVFHSLVKGDPAKIG